MKTRKGTNSLIQLVVDNPVIPSTIIVIAIMLLRVPNFGTLRNWITISEQLSITAVASVGLTFVIMTGNNDLSIAANLTLASVASAIFSVWLGMGTFLPILIGLAIGTLGGMLNGFFVAKFGINAFIITLTTQLLFEGLALIITDAQTIVGIPQNYMAIAETRILGIPFLIVIMVIFFFLGYLLLSKSAFGRRLIAIGSSKRAANLAGVNVVKTQFLAFVISGFCAGCSGIMLTARVGGATSSVGANMISDIISGTVIGGNSLSGGKGSMVGTLFGVFLIGIISNGINLLGIQYSVMLIIKGVIIVYALVMDLTKNRIMSKRLLRRN